MNEGQFERQLRELLKSAGWTVQSATDAGVDLVVERGELRYAVQIKYAKEVRRALLEGLLASAILRARAAALAIDGKPLAILCAPSFSNASLNELASFVSRFGEGAAWGVMDETGLVVLHGPALQEVGRQRRKARKPAVAQRTDFLSDLGQWMLKVLFSHRLPPELRFESALEHERIDEPIANAMTLARRAGVSVATASRFVSALKEEAFLVEGEAFLNPIRVDELLDQWRAAFKRRPMELRARWLFRPKDPLKQLDRVLEPVHKPGERACLGLFAACDRLGFRFVHGVAPHLYLEHVSNEVLQRLGLRPAEPGEAADVMVREPRYPESVFRGAQDRNGVPVADVLQCWLDVSENPARGEEMAEHLLDRVIRPSLLESDR